MARLPVPGQDTNTWGDILNDYLEVSHDANGNLLSSAVSAALPAQIPAAKLGSGTPTNLTYLRGDGAWATPAGGTVTSVTATDGTITVGGTSNNPTVGVGTIAESKVTNLTTDLASKAPLTNPTFTGIVSIPTLQVTGGTPATGKILTSDNSGNATWQVPTTQSGSTIDYLTPADSLLVTMRQAARSYSIQVVGDSTTVGVIAPSVAGSTDGWVADFGRQLASKFSPYTCYYRQLNSSTYRLDGPMFGNVANWVQLQNGTGNSGGQRGINLQGGVYGYDLGASSPLTGDIEIAAYIKPDTWAPSADQTIISQWSTANNQRAFYLSLRTTGVLQLNYSTDGTATSTANSTAAVPFTGSTAGYIKVSLDVDNGAAGRSVYFYTSTDGRTWTQLGSTVTVSTAITVYRPATAASYTADWSSPTSSAPATVPALNDVNRMLTLGARMTSGTFANQFHGTVYYIEVRNGIDGPSVVPLLAEDWEQLTDDTLASIVGAPMLVINASAASGRNLSYYQQYASNLLTATAPNLFILNDGHNNGYEQRQGYANKLDVFISTVKTTYPHVPIVLMSQNPIVVGAPSGGTNYTQQSADRRVARHEVLATYAAGSTNTYFVDCYRAFADLTTPSALLTAVGIVSAGTPDNLHPTRVQNAYPSTATASDATSGCRRISNYLMTALIGARV